MTLNNLGNRKSELGQREPALASAHEALDVIWSMFTDHPSAFYRSTRVMLRNVFERLQNLDQEPAPELIARLETFKSLAPEDFDR